MEEKKPSLWELSSHVMMIVGLSLFLCAHVQDRSAASTSPRWVIEGSAVAAVLLATMLKLKWRSSLGKSPLDEVNVTFTGISGHKVHLKLKAAQDMGEDEFMKFVDKAIDKIATEDGDVEIEKISYKHVSPPESSKPEPPHSP